MKNFFKIIFILIFIITTCNFASAQVDEKKYVEQGNIFLNKIEKNETPELNSMYAKKALFYFYTASKNNPPSTEALLGLGKIYLQLDRNEDAKNTFFRAYSLDYYNAETNFCFAEYNYKISDFDSALKFYKIALDLGYKDRNKTIEQIGRCYEKLGDLENALLIYQKCKSEECTKRYNSLLEEVK